MSKVQEITDLTSIRLLRRLYIDFKTTINESSMTLQKLTNRSIHLYLNDDQFREQLESADALTPSGSNF